MSPKKIIVLAGSTRQASVNRQLSNHLHHHALDLGADAQRIELQDYPMNIYQGDDEIQNGMPQAAQSLKQLLIEAQAFIFCLPEYNGNMTPVLLNAIAWVSRQNHPDERMLLAFANKPIALASASPSENGGKRVLAVASTMFQGMGMRVINPVYSLAKVHKCFDEQGNFVDAQQASAFKKTASAMIQALMDDDPLI